MRLGILVLAYNAEKTIADVLCRIPENVYERADGVYVFDDASSDGTSAVANETRAKLKYEKKIHVVKHPQNLGYGGNQKFSYQFAAKEGLGVVVMLHGDEQYAPELLEKIYSPILKGEADLVFGSRMRGKPLGGRMPFHKFVGNAVLTKIQNLLVGSHFSEFHSGYRAFRTSCLSALPLDRCTNGFHFDTQILILFFSKGYRIAEVPIPTFYGKEVSHVRIFSYGANVLNESLQYRLTKLFNSKSLYQTVSANPPANNSMPSPAGKSEAKQ